MTNLLLPVSKTTFFDHQAAVCAAAERVSERSMEAAAAELLEKFPDRQVAVTFDGTWQRRGHSSLNGAFTCISWDTGRVVDLHVSSKHCHACSNWSARREVGKSSQERFEEWRQTMKMSAVSIHSGLHQEWRARQLEFFGRGRKIVGS